MFSSKLHRLLVSKFQYQFWFQRNLKALAYWKCCFSSSLKPFNLQWVCLI